VWVEYILEVRARRCMVMFSINRYYFFLIALNCFFIVLIMCFDFIVLLLINGDECCINKKRNNWKQWETAVNRLWLRPN